MTTRTRAFSERFFKRTGRMPSMIHAGTYSATLSYLKAVKAAGTKDTEAVAKKLKELPVDDAFAKGKVLENGRMVHDMYLFEVKKPSESKKPWDYYKQLAVVPGDKAFFDRQGKRLPADEVRSVPITHVNACEAGTDAITLARIWSRCVSLHAGLRRDTACVMPRLTPTATPPPPAPPPTAQSPRCPGSQSPGRAWRRPANSR